MIIVEPTLAVTTYIKTIKVEFDIQHTAHTMDCNKIDADLEALNPIFVQ